MSCERPRIPPALETRLAHLLAVTTEHMEPGGVYYQGIAHDLGCPAIRTQRLVDCRCEPEFRAPRRVA
jgi:hypothetical protein